MFGSFEVWPKMSAQLNRNQLGCADWKRNTGKKTRRRAMPMGNTAMTYHAWLFGEALDTTINLIKRLIVKNDFSFLEVGRPRYIYIYVCVCVWAIMSLAWRMCATARERAVERSAGEHVAAWHHVNEYVGTQRCYPPHATQKENTQNARSVFP